MISILLSSINFLTLQSSLGPQIGLKMVVLEKINIINSNEMMTNLYYNLIGKGNYINRTMFYKQFMCIYKQWNNYVAVILMSQDIVYVNIIT